MAQKLAKKDSVKEHFPCLVTSILFTTNLLLDFLRSIFFIGIKLLSS